MERGFLRDDDDSSSLFGLMDANEHIDSHVDAGSSSRRGHVRQGSSTKALASTSAESHVRSIEDDFHGHSIAFSLMLDDDTVDSQRVDNETNDNFEDHVIEIYPAATNGNLSTENVRGNRNDQRPLSWSRPMYVLHSWHQNMTSVSRTLFERYGLDGRWRWRMNLGILLESRIVMLLALVTLVSEPLFTVFALWMVRDKPVNPPFDADLFYILTSSFLALHLVLLFIAYDIRIFRHYGYVIDIIAALVASLTLFLTRSEASSFILLLGCWRIFRFERSIFSSTADTNLSLNPAQQHESTSPFSEFTNVEIVKLRRILRSVYPELSVDTESPEDSAEDCLAILRAQNRKLRLALQAVSALVEKHD